MREALALGRGQGDEVSALALVGSGADHSLRDPSEHRKSIALLQLETIPILEEGEGEGQG